MTKTWWEAPMGGSVSSFLKAEWKVSDTGSAHWASRIVILIKKSRSNFSKLVIMLSGQKINNKSIFFVIKHRWMASKKVMIEVV